MPTIYSWYLALPLGAGGAASSGAGVGTGVDGRRAYAYTRELDPLTGDVVFSAPRRTWAPSAPLVQKVLRVLSVEKGTALRDLAYGTAWARLDNARANADVVAKQVITEAVAFLVTAGELVDLSVAAEALPAAGAKALLLKVSFADARGQLFALTGRPLR